MILFKKNLFFGLVLTAFSPFSIAESIDDYLVLAKIAANRGDYAGIQNAEIFLKNTIFKEYPFYWWVTKNSATTSSEKFISFLSGNESSFAFERTKTIFSKNLAADKKWSDFRVQISGLKEKDLELKCYESNFDSIFNGKLDQVMYSNLKVIFSNEKKVPEGCYSYISDLYKNNLISENELWYFVRWSLSNNQITYAKKISELTPTPIASYLNVSTNRLNNRARTEAILFNIQKMFSTNFSENDLHKFIFNNSQHLSSLDISYIWGRFALFSAKKLKSENALVYFGKSDPLQLNEEQWGWWVRSALREERWSDVLNVIEKMPLRLSEKPDWQYWKARALKFKNKNLEANLIFNTLKNINGFGYYSLLSQDEVGTIQKNIYPNTVDYKFNMDRLQSNPGINRALTLLKISISKNDPSFREDAKKEWRFAMKNLNDEELLSASELALRHDFYEMAIYSAEKTNQIHDKSLRYLTPYKEYLEGNAAAVGLSQSWVYGLIRQESRFVNVARSGVGASGLMQLMPATAKWVAGKVGMGVFDINDINTNIKLGTWYLSHVTDSLGHPVLATAAYNAGPGRAKSWQANRSLEGAIYAETIPFDETRDYVKKVMSNTVVYDSLLNNKSIRLKDVLGSIPARSL